MKYKQFGVNGLERLRSSKFQLEHASQNTEDCLGKVHLHQSVRRVLEVFWQVIHQQRVSVRSLTPRAGLVAIARLSRFFQSGTEVTTPSITVIPELPVRNNLVCRPRAATQWVTTQGYYMSSQEKQRIVRRQCDEFSLRYICPPPCPTFFVSDTFPPLSSILLEGKQGCCSD